MRLSCHSRKQNQHESLSLLFCRKRSRSFLRFQYGFERIDILFVRRLPSGIPSQVKRAELLARHISFNHFLAAKSLRFPLIATVYDNCLHFYSSTNLRTSVSVKTLFSNSRLPFLSRR